VGRGLKYLLTGDWHVNYRSNNNIFIKIALDFLDYLEEYCFSNDIREIIFLGDMFEKSSRVRHEAFVPLFLKLFEKKSKGLNFTFVLGNHDIYSIDNDSIVETFRPLGLVVKEGSFTKKMSFLSYTKNPNKIQKETDYLFTHLAIADFQFDNLYNANETIAMKRDLFSSYKRVFTGHFHKHQVKDNIVYVGDPWQLHFGERDTAKGFVVLDTDKDEWKFVEYNVAPTFKIIDLENFNDMDVRNCFVGVRIERKIENFVKLKYILYERGALDVVPFFIAKKEAVVDTTSVKHTQHISSIPAMTRDFLKSIKIDNIDNNKLLKLFDKIVEKLV
jgi:DNA repair exonuclease SbcCD nuclease subunit